LAVDVFTIYVGSFGDEGCAAVTLGVALLELVELITVLKLIKESHFEGLVFAFSKRVEIELGRFVNEEKLEEDWNWKNRWSEPLAQLLWERDY